MVIFVEVFYLSPASLFSRSLLHFRKPLTFIVDTKGGGGILLRPLSHWLHPRCELTLFFSFDTGAASFPVPNVF